MSNYGRTKWEPDGSVTTWESDDGRSWHMTGQTYLARPAGALADPPVTHTRKGATDE